MAGESHPKAREGLLTSDHSKRGRRYLIILDRAANKVTLLEPWEHAILILCDGTRDATQIAKLLEKGVEGEPIDLRVVQRCLKYFEREALIEPIGLRSRPVTQEFESPGPRTLAGLQQAYREWHKDPVRTGHILSGLFAPPFVDPGGGFFRAGLDPTVALPDDQDGEHKGTVQVGSMLVLADADSLLHKGPPPAAATVPASPPPTRQRIEPETLIGPLSEPGAPRTGGAAMVSAEEFEPDQDVAELLKAVDHDFQEVETREARERAQSKRHGKKHVPPPVGKAIGGEARLPEARERKRPTAKVLMSVEPDAALVRKLDEVEVRGVERLPSHRSIPMSEAALRPTMVGLPPNEPTKENAPILLVPPRSDTPADDRKIDELAPTERPAKSGGSIPMSREETIPFDPDVEQTLRLPAALVLGEELASAALIFDLGNADEATEGNIGAFGLGELGGGGSGAKKAAERSVKTDKKDKKRGVHDENTEPRYRQKGAKTRGGSPTATMRAAKVSPFDDSNPSQELNLPARAREVFERLRKAGLKARTQSGDDGTTPRGGDPKVPRRRRNEEDSRRFDAAINSLSAGELEVALKHFRRLHDKMPQSKRLAAFIEAIEAVRTGADARPDEDRDPDTLKKPAQRHGSTQRILDEFEGVLEEAVAYGRCPACFSMVAKNFTSCFACGFALERGGE